MPVYILRPIDPDDPDWIASSTYRGPCRVHAQNEEAARVLVARFFWPEEVPALPTPGARPSPWVQSNDADCARVDNPPPEEYREGQIEVYESGGGATLGSFTLGADQLAGDGDGVWVVVREGQPPPQPDVETGADAAIARHAAQRDEAQSATAAMSGSVLPPLQQRGEGPGVDQGNRAELTLPSIQMHAEGGGVGTRAVTQQTHSDVDDPVSVFRRRLTSAPEDVTQAVRFAIEQADQRLDYLRDKRSNAPEASEAIEAIKRHKVVLSELLQGVEAGDPVDQSVARWQRMMGLLLDELEKFLEAKVLVRTAFLGVVVSTCAALGVGDLAQAIVVGSAVAGDRKILEGLMKLFNSYKAK